MATVKYADSVYSFRATTSLIAQFVDTTPDAATLAQIEADLSDAAKAFYQGRYQDSINLYKAAGVIIYQYIDPMASLFSPAAWDSLSFSPAMFDPLLNVSALFMNVLPIPSPQPVQAVAAAAQPSLGKPAADATGLRSTTLNSLSAVTAAAEMQLAAGYRNSGLTNGAQTLEAKATKADSNVAGLFKGIVSAIGPPGVAAPPKTSTVRNQSAVTKTLGAKSRSEAATSIASAQILPKIRAVATVPNLAGVTPISATRLSTNFTLPPSLNPSVLEGRTLGIYTNKVSTQVSWGAGSNPDLPTLKNAVYGARISAENLFHDILLFPQQPSDVALSLPHAYYYTIPLGIAEALHAMGDYANAETYYFQAASYQFLNQAVEVPYLFRRISQLYLDWGNDYFMNGDSANALPVYEKVITHADAVPSSSLYTTASLKAAADVARTIIASINNVSALPTTINPEQIAIIVSCYGALTKISAGLDFWGMTTNSVPIWTFAYLQSVAINFCQLAISAEQAFITYQDKADQSELTLQQLNQQVVQAQAQVSAAQLQVAQAQASADAYKAGLDLANLRAANSKADVTAYSNASWYQIQYQAETTQVQGGDDGDPGYVNYLADQLLSGNTIEGSTSTVAAATQLAGAKVNRDYEIGSLQRTAGEMQAAAVQAQAELTAANAGVAAAQADVTVAQLRASGAQAMVNQFDSSFFTPDVWWAMGQTMYALYQRYFNMALKVAKLMTMISTNSSGVGLALFSAKDWIQDNGSRSG